MGKEDLKETYHAVRERIGEAAARGGRKAEDVAVVAVTKYTELDRVRALIDLGHADFGENQGQQLAQRVPQIEEFAARKRQLGGESAAERIRWHMVGHLQRNKVKQVVPLVDLVHSVDSLRLIEELHNYGAKIDSEVDIRLQVNISGETSKSGVLPPAVIPLIEQIDLMMHLRLRGLMTMAPQADNPEDIRPVFRRCRELFEECAQLEASGPDFNLLSMGMSGDYEVAVEEGANVVRLGRALFGERDA